MPTCEKCNESFPNRLSIDGVFRNMQRRKFCLKCSPYGEHNTKSMKAKLKTEDTTIAGSKACSKCSVVKELGSFYDKVIATVKQHGGYSKCKSCMNDEKMDKFREFYIECVDYKGDSCKSCGFSDNKLSLEFHGNPDVSISTIKTFKLTTDLKSKLDATNLLCSNCHKTIHRSGK